jgi:hypothetical protein
MNVDKNMQRSSIYLENKEFMSGVTGVCMSLFLCRNDELAASQEHDPERLSIVPQLFVCMFVCMYVSM